MKENLYSIKMRATRDDKHISGAERISAEKGIEGLVQQLTARALEHSKGKPDAINISIQNIDNQTIKYIDPLDITTITVDNYFKGRDCAVKALQKSGLSYKTSQMILNLLRKSKTMRGAILLDINSLERLEPDKERGVRVTHIDWSYKIREVLDKALQEKWLNNNHIKEAVALASKVCNAPGIVAELCWSDDPDYTAGYVASRDGGYMRITELKPLGSLNGGRVFCFDATKASIEECIAYLQKEVTLINKLPIIKEHISCEAFMEGE